MDLQQLNKETVYFMHLRNRQSWMHLVDFGPLAGKSIPQDDSSLIVTAGQKVLVIAAPADTADLTG